MACDDFLECLYAVRRDDIEPFGQDYCGPQDRFVHGQDTLVAVYPGRGYGRSAVIYCRAIASRFYTIDVLPSKDCRGRPLPKLTLSTGSGTEMAKLAVAIAKAFASGVLGHH